MVQLEDCFIQQPTEAQGYRIAAEAMLAGAIPLLKADPLPTIALTLLCGHGTEAGLKALLAQSGLAASVLSRQPYAHDLVALWDKAVALGSNLSAPRSPWVDQLQRVYVAPYSLRYPLGFHGIVLPNQLQMVEGLQALVAVVAAQVR